MRRAQRLSTLLAGAGVRPLFAPTADPEILGVSIDSRRVAPGHLFFALSGANVDGNAFVLDALSRGAKAIVSASAKPAGWSAEAAWVRVEEPRRHVGPVAKEWFGRPDDALTLVGITGTNGKTTVAYLVESIARAAGREAGRLGTVTYSFGDTEIHAERTTPEATELFELFARMRDAGTEVVAMEVSSHALAMHRVGGVRFSVAAFLNLGRDHLDFHGSVERYFEAKAQLFDGLGPAASAVLPVDDPSGMSLAGRTRARVVTFGRGEGATVRIRQEHCAPTESTATLRIEDADLQVRTRLVGRFNLDNVAAAAACAVALGIPAAAIAAGVIALQNVPGRMEPIRAGQPFTVLVDYAHTEQALSRMLAAARELTPGRLIVVFGCGGDRDRGKRPDMGRAAASVADRIFLTSDNPRGEDPASILDEIAAGVASVAGGMDRCHVIPLRKKAVTAALRWAAPGDTVVLAGKGHETTQTSGVRVSRLDDRELARTVLALLGWSGSGSADA